MKIKSLIAIFGCILVSSAVFVLGLCTSIVSYTTSTNSVNNDMKASTEYYSLLIKSKLDLIKFEIEFAGKDEQLVNIRKSVADRIQFLSDAAVPTDFEKLMVSFSSGMTYEDKDVSSEDFFKKSSEKLTYIAKPKVNEDGSLTFICSTYIAGFYHEFDLVLFGELPYDMLGSLVSNSKIGNTGYGFIVDEAGTVIFHPDTEVVKNSVNYITSAQTDNSFSDMANTVQKMMNKENGIDTINFSGQKCYISYIPIEGPENWSYATIVPVGEMLSGFYSSLAITFVVFVIMVLIGAIASIIVANKLSSPIVSVAERLELLAEGDLKTELDDADTKTLEINRLYRSINIMLHKLNSYISDIGNVLSGLANHDLTIKPEVIYSGDFSSINTSLNMICGSLNDIFGTLDSVSSDISDGSKIIEDCSINLAQSTAEQSANIIALTDNIGSISNQIKGTVEHTAHAHELTQLAVEFVDHGTERMNAMLQSMDKISESSNAIRKITKTIEDIAFQTNILALNAAVEAARAGEAGKGFAVVADEVKNLATKSGEAAKTTTKLIKDTLDAIDKGTSRADQASESLKSITVQVEKVQNIIADIKNAAAIEAESISSVKQNLSNITNATQTTNHASVQSENASKKFSNDAKTLSNIVDNFEIGHIDEKRIEQFRKNIQKERAIKQEKQAVNSDGDIKPEDLSSPDFEIEIKSDNTVFEQEIILHQAEEKAVQANENPKEKKSIKEIFKKSDKPKKEKKDKIVKKEKTDVQTEASSKKNNVTNKVDERPKENSTQVEIKSAIISKEKEDKAQPEETKKLSSNNMKPNEAYKTPSIKEEKGKLKEKSDKDTAQEAESHRAKIASINLDDGKY